MVVVGSFGGGGTTLIILPNAQYRINSNLLGPEENIVLYLGGSAGVAVFTGAISKTVGSFGPRVGLEYYISPRVALQLEDSFQFDTDSGKANAVTVGVKILFD
jgi:hypothetical protein